jgi:hypothetical protein
MDGEGPGEYPIRKRNQPEQCRYWEQKLLEIAQEMPRDKRTVVIGAALFLGELSEKLPENGGDEEEES